MYGYDINQVNFCLNRCIMYDLLDEVLGVFRDQIYTAVSQWGTALWCLGCSYKCDVISNITNQ